MSGRRRVTALAVFVLAFAAMGALAPAARAQTYTYYSWYYWYFGYGNLKVGGASGVQYRYERDGLTFELRPRGGSWSLQEALWVRDAMDQWPYAFLSKVAASGATILYRDGASPSAPWDFIYKPDNIIAVAVPPWPWNFTAYADGCFGSADAVYYTVCHEFGHCAQWNEAGYAIIFGTGFTWISWTGISEPFGKRSWNGYVTNYALTNHREDYAESCAYYALAPGALYSVSPSKFWYMHDRVFGGWFPPASAQRSLGTLPWRYPELWSLGDWHDEVWGFVAVYGARFMGPFDGGYNRVYYGNSVATHVPISQSTIWTWVPDIPQGWTGTWVLTQDGWSNGVWFYCDGRPWWMFW